MIKVALSDTKRTPQINMPSRRRRPQLRPHIFNV
jgi:hypothetical protein